MELTIDRKIYAETVGVEEEELEPWPEIAPARDGVTVMPFTMAHPTQLPFLEPRNEWMEASFECERMGMFNQGAIRYGNHKPVYLATNREAVFFAGQKFCIAIRVTCVK